MDPTCICGHGRREHGKQEDRPGDMACDRCACNQYQPDPEFRELGPPPQHRLDALAYAFECTETAPIYESALARLSPWPKDDGVFVMSNPPRTIEEFERLYLNQPFPDVP